jgi:hypothetical protein
MNIYPVKKGSEEKLSISGHFGSLERVVQPAVN